jgi:hypothetical protein
LLRFVFRRLALGVWPAYSQLGIYSGESMASDTRSKIATGLGALALLLVGANIVLATGNRAARDDVNQRQQKLNAGGQLATVNNALIQALVVAAANRGDAEIASLLQANGISYQVQPTQAPAVSPVPPAGQ